MIGYGREEERLGENWSLKGTIRVPPKHQPQIKIEELAALVKYSQRNHHWQSVHYRGDASGHFGGRWTHCPGASCTMVFNKLFALGIYNQKQAQSRHDFINKLRERAMNR